VFYYVKWRDNQCGWEIMYVMSVECVSYTMALTLPYDVLYPEMMGGHRFCWFRYVMWAMTCPILIQQIIRVLTENEPDLNIVSKLMVSNIMMDLMGATAAIYSDIYVKVTALTLAFLLFFGLMYSLAFIWMGNRKNFAEGTSRSRRDALIAMLSTWTIFPVLFVLGPAVANVLSFTQSSALHGIGDLLAKNMVGFTSWKIRHAYRANEVKKKKKLDKIRRGMSMQQGGQPMQNMKNQRAISIDHITTDHSTPDDMSDSSQQVQQVALHQQMQQMQQQMQAMQQQLQHGGSPVNGSPRNNYRPRLERENSSSFVEDLGLTPAMDRLGAQDKMNQYNSGLSIDPESTLNHAAGSPLLNAYPSSRTHKGSSQFHGSYSPVGGSLEPAGDRLPANQARSLPPQSGGFNQDYHLKLARGGSPRSGSPRNGQQQRGKQFTSIMT